MDEKELECVWGYMGVDATMIGMRSHKYDDLLYAFTRLHVEYFSEQIEACLSVGMLPVDDDVSALRKIVQPVTREFRHNFVRALCECRLCPYIRSFRVASAASASEGSKGTKGSEAAAEEEDDSGRFMMIELGKQRRGLPFMFGAAQISEGECDAFHYDQLTPAAPDPDTPIYFNASAYRTDLTALGAYYAERARSVSNRRGVDAVAEVWKQGRQKNATVAQRDAFDKFTKIKREFLTDLSLRTTVRAFYGASITDTEYMQCARHDEHILRHIASIAAHKNLRERSSSSNDPNIAEDIILV